MEELLKNISGRNTFTISRNPNKKNNFLDADKLGIAYIPPPTSVAGDKKPVGDLFGNPQDIQRKSTTTITKRFKDDMIGCESTTMLFNPKNFNLDLKHQNNFRLDSFSNFILQDSNFFLQRKILLQQGKLQKLSMAAFKDKSNSKILSTKGLDFDEGFSSFEEESNKNQQDSLLNWPQCKEIIGILIITIF